MIVVDALLVEMESGFACVDRHRDRTNRPHSLLQILGTKKNMRFFRVLASIHDFLGVNVHSLLCFMRGIHSVVMRVMLLTASDLWGMSTQEVRFAPELVALYKHFLPEPGQR